MRIFFSSPTRICETPASRLVVRGDVRYISRTCTSSWRLGPEKVKPNKLQRHEGGKSYISAAEVRIVLFYYCTGNFAWKTMATMACPYAGRGWWLDLKTGNL